MTTYTSDAYGRRTRALSSAEGTTTYTWDPLGHLTEVASADATSTYEYGISGMRERVTVETTAGVTWRESVWSGGELVSERDSDYTTLTYVWGPDRTPLSIKVTSSVHPSGTYYYHTDAAGSVTALTDESGEVVASYSYDAFGAVTDVGGSDAWLAGRNPLRYRAYYADDQTGLYYLPARYYEPETARFLSPDPAPPSAGDPLSLNAYTYCQGDPVNASDPSGAVIDVDGDGRVGVEDTLSQSYISAKPGKAGSQQAARKYAKKLAASAAAFSSSSGNKPRDVSGCARGAYAWGYSEFMRVGGEPQYTSGIVMWRWALTSPQDDPIGYGWSTVGALCDIGTLACPPTAFMTTPLGMGAGLVEFGHVILRYPESTEADVLMSLAGIVPIVGLYKPLKGAASTAEFISGVDYIMDTASWFE